MSHTVITTSAPGSLMLAGEHAVLHGRHALAGAVDRRMRVAITPRDDDQIIIRSALGERHMTRQLIDTTPPFTFVGAALAAYASLMETGCQIEITADFAHDVGLGSSSAVTVALMAGLGCWLREEMPDPTALMWEAIGLIREVQGLGSGTDVAASVHGGIVLYRADPPDVLECFSTCPDIELLYAGYKTPTPEVVKLVEAERRQSPERFEQLFDRADAVALQAAAALRQQDWTALGQALNEGQVVMAGLGVSDEALTGLVAQLQAAPTIYGAKISGSGLGDCVIGIGAWGQDPPSPCRRIPVSLSSQGVIQE